MGNMARLEAALRLFGLEGAAFSLIRHNENEIYDVKTREGRRVLRVHAPAPGFEPLPLCRGNSFAQREAETELLLRLGDLGLRVQKPVPGLDGKPVQRLPDGTAATLLAWLPGESYDALWRGADIPEDAAYAAGRIAGEMDAFLHGETRAFFGRRPRYGLASFPVVEARLRAARAEGAINEGQLNTMLRALDAMKPRIRTAERATGLTVCHADMSAGNLIWDGTRAAPIDFSLAGIASPYLDIGMMFANFTRENVRRGLIAGFEDGYGKRARLRLAEPYYALGILLFICLRYRSAKDWDWFPAALERWCRECFLPLACGEPFIDRPASASAPFTPASKTP